MTIRLSHSSTSLFSECAKKYEYKYIKNLHPKITHAALLFGSALDKAIEQLLKTKDINLAMDEFIKSWTSAEINGVKEDLKCSPKLVYSNADFDSDLTKFSSEDLIEYSSIQKQKDAIGYQLLKRESKIKFNSMNWECLLAKGKLMVDAFNRYVMPNIEEVLGTQLQVDLVNEEGDTIIGFVDFIVKWKGKESPIIFDLKTSSRNYDDNSVLTSPQLTLYVHGLGYKYKTRTAGFIVLNKNIRKNKTKICSVCGFDGTGAKFKTCNNDVDGKRCGAEWTETCKPEVYFQVLIDEINDRLEEIMLENYNSINACIKNNIFPRSLNMCKAAYGICPYYKVCYSNDTGDVIEVIKK